jgi:hypothetical protein
MSEKIQLNYYNMWANRSNEIVHVFQMRFSEALEYYMSKYPPK